MKFICAILVVCIHCGPLLSINKEANFFLVQVCARTAVPFFFVASAFFFFKKLDYYLGLKDAYNIQLLKRYLFRIFKLYVVWSCVYLIVSAFTWVQDGFTIKTLFLYIRDFFFTGSYYHLWFLPAIIFSTLVIYYLLHKFSAKELLLVTCTFYFIGMFINVYGDFFNQIPIISNFLSLYLKIFVTARNGLFFGLIYTYMGYFLARKTIPMEWKSPFYRCVICFVLLIGEVYFIRWLGYMNDLTSMYIMLLPFMYYFFLTLMQFTSQKGIPLLRNASTLIYVSHILFTIIIGKIPFFTSNSLLYFGLVIIFSCLFSFGILILSRKRKFLRVFY